MSTNQNKGHRERLREQFLAGNEMQDRHQLELLLTYAIPRIDVRPIAVSLLDVFGSLEGVLNASIDELQLVEGIGPNSAILISLTKAISDSVQKQKNNNIHTLDSTEQTIEYFRNEIGSSKTEKLIAVSMDNNGKIIKTHLIAAGGINNVDVDYQRLVHCVLVDKAASVIIGHNHPKGGCEPSGADIDATIEITNLFRKLKIRLADHIIVGENDALSMRTRINLADYFD